MTSQERQFYVAILFNMCRYWRAREIAATQTTKSKDDYLMSAIDHVAKALRTPAFEIVR